MSNPHKEMITSFMHSEMALSPWSAGARLRVSAYENGRFLCRIADAGTEESYTFASDKTSGDVDLLEHSRWPRDGGASLESVQLRFLNYLQSMQLAV